MGPSSRFELLKKAARKRGLELFAKTEASQSIEMFVLPRLPVMYRWAQRAAVIRKAGVDGVHTAWRFYGFCGQMTDEIINHYAWAPRPEIGELLRTIAERDFGKRAAERVLGAWRDFSEAFGRFPYSGGITGFPYFRGPFYLGPAHPLVFDLTVASRLDDAFYRSDPSLDEMGAGTGSVDPRFFVDLTWTQPFGPRKIRTSLSRMEQQWRRGLRQLAKATPLAHGAQRSRLKFECDLGMIIHCTFCTALNLLDFQLARNKVTALPCTLNQLKRTCQDALAIVRRERVNARLALEISTRNPCIGFGSTYGRGFSADLIRKKIEHCDWQIEHGIPGFRDNYSFHIFAEANIVD